MQSAPSSSVWVEIYRRMTRIKVNDARIIATMKAGRLTMPYYSPRGQECIPAAVSVLLSDQDYLEEIRLKKKKLQLKDQMNAMISRLREELSHQPS